MPSELKSLSKIFTETIFRIPDYQRGYAWGKRQLFDFWNDIEQLPDDKKHYTGVLTVEPVPKEIYSKWDDDLWIIESKRYTPLYIVDGQQRLTTIIILLQSLIETLHENESFNYSSRSEIANKYIYERKGNNLSKSFIFGYEKDNPSYEYLKREILLQSSNDHFVLEKTAYTNNLYNAKSFFKEKLSNLSFQQREKIFTKVTQCLEFNIFYIEPSLDVFVTFETMNNRGKPLSHLELLKTRLIYLATRFENLETHEISHLRKNINEAWKDMFHVLGIIAGQNCTYENELAISNDDTFLLIHYLYYFSSELIKNIEDSEEGKFKLFRLIRYEQFKDNLLNEKFSGKRISDSDSPLTHTDILDYTNDIRLLSKMYLWVTNPHQSSWSDDIKIKLFQLNRIGGFEEILLATFIMENKKSSELEKFNALLHLEQMTFLRTFSRMYYQDMPDLPLLSIKLAAGRKSVQEIITDLTNASNRLISFKEFEDNLKKIGQANKGFYGWRGIKYFFYEYEQELKIISKENRDKLDWFLYSKEIYNVDYKTIEHIYPTRANNKYWQNSFLLYSTKEKNKLRNSLGNLLPLSTPKNSSLSNKSFLEKKLNNSIGYKYGCYSEVEVATAEDWGAIEILTRGLMLLDFLEYRWKITIGNDMKKLHYLGLDFILEKEKQTLPKVIKESIFKKTFSK